MKRNLRLGIAQINCTVGDFAGNCANICDKIGQANSLGVDVLSFPELSITGYPPEDLLLKAQFIEDNISALKKVAKCVGDMVAVVGFVDSIKGHIYNAAAVIYKGEIKGVYHKMNLPNYGVFDEKRYFSQGNAPSVFLYGDVIFGVNICEDIWHKGRPTAIQSASGAHLIININASPYYSGKIKLREEVICAQARANKTFISYANLAGGQDELVFDGQSMFVNASGETIARGAAFAEDLLATDIIIDVKDAKPPKNAIIISPRVMSRAKPPIPKRETKEMSPVEEVYKALLLGLGDYIKKNAFKKVVVAISGGIDSALVATLAVDVLGKSNVIGVFMPSRYTSSRSEEDIKTLAANLGIRFISISIEPIFKLSLMSLDSQFTGLGRDTAEENLQARIRGNLIMTLSNKFGWLVLTTGNKSEMSTGYATLYGDMAGGFAVIKDVPKMLVYKLASYRNRIKMVIPESIIKREPTAELKAGQKDADTLPPYDILDLILKAYVEEDRGFGEIVKMGFDKETVSRVLELVDKSEYKRRQSPPGIKITPKAFGKDRRMPITNKYR